MQFKVHPQRTALHNEIHARRPEPVTAPLALSHVVMFLGAADRALVRAHLARLLADHHQPEPQADANHVRADFGRFRLRWELHTEFVSWIFMRPMDPANFDAEHPPTALEAVPQGWLAAMPGELLAAKHLWVFARPAEEEQRPMLRLLDEEMLVGSRVTDGHAEVYTDFLIHPDGYSRSLVMAGDIPPRRLGRLVQRVMEIETYRMAALLGLPVARAVNRALATAESELAELADAIRSANADNEPELLDRLTRLAGQIESEYAHSHARFSATRAYYDLVNRRTAEIGETRLGNLQTISEFMDRRLSPAMNTIDWAARRQQALSERVSRVSNLLRTRVEIEQQQSNQALLETMTERQGIQLKLQSAVESLSVAAISYYIVGLIGYFTKGLKPIGWPLSSEMTTAIAIPFVIGGVWWSMHRLHRKLMQQ